MTPALGRGGGQNELGLTVPLPCGFRHRRAHCSRVLRFPRITFVVTRDDCPESATQAQVAASNPGGTIIRNDARHP